MTTEPKADFRQILRTLTEHHVKFIVVGGVSAVLQGVPFSTFDLDVVHARDPQNVERLLQSPLKPITGQIRKGGRSQTPRTYPPRDINCS